MKFRIRKTFIIWLSLIILIILSYFVHTELEFMKAGTTVYERIRYIPSGRILKNTTLGYDELIADILWIETVQYIGRKKISVNKNDKTISIMADTATILDPYYQSVYEVSAGIIAAFDEQYTESIELLKKGITRMGDHLKRTYKGWRLPYMIGFNYYFYLDDPKSAVPYLKMASELPGRMNFVPSITARIMAEAEGGRNIETAIEFIKTFIDNTENRVLKEGYKEILIDLLTTKNVLILRRYVEIFKKKFGYIPDDLNELIEGGIIRRIPEHPFKGRYFIDKKDGLVKSTFPQNRQR